MHKQVLKTWTFCLLFCFVIPSLSVSALENKTEPKTLYEAAIRKCPRLEKTDLHENWKDVFDNQCSNWTVIDGVKEFTKQNTRNVQCLLLYESIMSFCTGIGDIEANLSELIPTPAHTKYNLTEICLSKTGIPDLKGSDHNISNFVHYVDCILICISTEKSSPEASDVCKLAYFFKAFDTEKFSQHFKLHLKNKPTPQIPTNIKEVAPEPAKENESKPLESGEGNQKPKQTVNDEQIFEKVQAEDPPQLSITANNKTKIELPVSEKAEVPAPAQQPSILPNPLDADSEKQNDKIEDDSLPDPDDVNANVLNKEQLRDQIDDDLKDEGDGPDQEGFPPENDSQLSEHELRVQEQVTKGKPSTLLDEPVSNINISENDMDGDSYFFSYFSVIMCLVIVGYVGYHNRHKILALLLEGKRGKRNGRSGRRPNSANYHKLDTNLEEAISSSCTKNPPSNIIY